MAADLHYWRDRPERWLLDETIERLTPEEFMAYFWILQRSRTCTPPGVITGGEQRLADWSRLSKAAWKKAREAVLRLFPQDDQGRYHHPPSKAEFYSYAQLCHDKRLAALSRHTKKGDGRKNSTPPPAFSDPYRTFGGAKSPEPSHANVENVVFVPPLQVHAHAQHVQTDAMHASEDRSIDRMDREINGAAPPPPAGGASAPAPPTPNPSRLTPEEFTQRRTAQVAALSAAAALDTPTKEK